MAITMQKTIPGTSNFYTTGGDITITLSGVEEVTFHSKKTMIKISRPKTPSRQILENSDEFDNKVLDLKQGTDVINIKGWIEDDSTETAWNKAWKIRAMCSRGGPLTNLTIDNIQFTSATQQAFLEDIAFTAKADDTGALNTAQADGIARVSVQLNFFIGDER
jgi:hypothetical protein